MGLVEIEIEGKSHRVPEGITAVQALWRAGHEILKGIGCLGGVCGACTFTYSRRGEPGVKTGLACQTPVRAGMSFSPPVSAAQTPRRYRIREIDDPPSALFKLYPEIRRCTRCDACTQVCPQGIPVRTGVVKALSGEMAEVSDIFYDCIMCGLCAAVCDVQIQPNLIGLYVRRAQAARLDRPPVNLSRRVGEIASDRYASAWQAVLGMDERQIMACDADRLADSNG